MIELDREAASNPVRSTPRRHTLNLGYVPAQITYVVRPAGSQVSLCPFAEVSQSLPD